MLRDFTDLEQFGTPPANDQYLLGNELLIAPINQPGQRRRNVTLPYTPGGWLDFETGQVLADSLQLVGLPAPLGHIPLLVRAGAIIPITAYHPSIAAFQPDTLCLRYFPSTGNVGERSFTLYEDDGRSAQALARQEYVTFQLKTSGVTNWGDTGWGATGGHNVTIRKRGSYPGQPARRFVQLEVMRVAFAPTTVLLNEKPLPMAAWIFDTIRHVLTVNAPLGNNTAISLPGLRLLTTPVANHDPETLTLTVPDSRTFSGTAGLHYECYQTSASPPLLRIRNASGQVVRELPTDTSTGPHTAQWDGNDDRGHPTTPGLYDVELAGQHQRLVRLP